MSETLYGLLKTPLTLIVYELPKTQLTLAATKVVMGASGLVFQNLILAVFAGRGLGPKDVPVTFLLALAVKVRACAGTTGCTPRKAYLRCLFSLALRIFCIFVYSFLHYGHVSLVFLCDHFGIASL